MFAEIDTLSTRSPTIFARPMAALPRSARPGWRHNRRDRRRAIAAQAGVTNRGGWR
jgi:hypothetical protein